MNTPSDLTLRLRQCKFLPEWARPKPRPLKSGSFSLEGVHDHFLLFLVIVGDLFDLRDFVTVDLSGATGLTTGLGANRRQGGVGDTGVTCRGGDHGGRRLSGVFTRTDVDGNSHPVVRVRGLGAEEVLVRRSVLAGRRGSCALLLACGRRNDANADVATSSANDETIHYLAVRLVHGEPDELSSTACASAEVDRLVVDDAGDTFDVDCRLEVHEYPVDLAVSQLLVDQLLCKHGMRVGTCQVGVECLIGVRAVFEEGGVSVMSTGVALDRGVRGVHVKRALRETLVDNEVGDNVCGNDISRTECELDVVLDVVVGGHHATCKQERSGCRGDNSVLGDSSHGVSYPLAFDVSPTANLVVVSSGVVEAEG